LEASLNGSLDGLEFDNTADVIEKSTVIEMVKDLKMLVNEAQQQVKNLNIPVVSVPLPVIIQVLKYCEDNQIYDKLGTYQDFYYKLNQIRRECEESNVR
jgi:hypothetical protein